MSYSDWLSQVGLGISAVFSWLVDCIDTLKDNYIILTILGLSLFFFLFNTITSLINWFHQRDIDNYIPKHEKGRYIPKHGRDN